MSRISRVSKASLAISIVTSLFRDRNLSCCCSDCRIWLFVVKNWSHFVVKKMHPAPTLRRKFNLKIYNSCNNNNKPVVVVLCCCYCSTLINWTNYCCCCWQQIVVVQHYWSLINKFVVVVGDCGSYKFILSCDNNNKTLTKYKEQIRLTPIYHRHPFCWHNWRLFRNLSAVVLYVDPRTSCCEEIFSQSVLNLM